MWLIDWCYFCGLSFAFLGCFFCSCFVGNFFFDCVWGFLVWVWVVLVVRDSVIVKGGEALWFLVLCLWVFSVRWVCVGVLCFGGCVGVGCLWLCSSFWGVWFGGVLGCLCLVFGFCWW